MKIAAVVYEPGEAKALDDLLRDVAGDIIASGLRLAGTVQRNEASSTNACANMVLQDLVTSRLFDISVPVPTKTQACSLNPAALEDVAGHVGATLDGTVDLVIVNRFGKQEVMGCGLRSVIEQAVAEEVPVLTALCSAHLESWNAFAGSEWTRLPLHRGVILSWCRTVSPARHLQNASASAD